MPKALFRHQEKYNGVRIDLTANTKRDLARKVAERKELIDSQTIKGTTTVRKWFETWLALYKKGKVSERYYNSIKSRIEIYALPKIGDMAISQVREIHIQEIINSCAGKSKSHVTKLRINISEMFDRAKNNHYIAYNPCTDIQLPEYTSGSHRPLTKDERVLFLKACEDSGDIGIWGKLLLYTGIRPQESVPLKIMDVDFSTMRLSVNQALKSEGNIDGPKTESGVRLIPIPQILVSDLKQIIGDRKPDEYLFIRKGGIPMSHGAIKYRWNKVIYKKMQTLADAQNNALLLGDDLTLYCLRHTYCTDLLRAKVPITTAKVLMGHSSTDMVDKIYGHHTEDQTEEAKQMLNALYAEGF